MQWLKEAASPRTPRGGRLREAKGMTRKRGSSFWKGAAPELHEQCSVRFDHGSLFGLQNEIADGWPERRGPAVRLASSLEASAERSYVGALFGGGARSRRTVWLRLEKGPLLVYEEPIYALSRVDLMVERVPSGGGKRIGRVDLSQVKLHADVHDGGDGDDEQTPSLTLSSASGDEGELVLLFASFEEMLGWWKAFSRVQTLARRSDAGIYGGAAGDGAPEAPDVARVASPRGSRSRTASSAARASMSGRDDFEDGPLVEDGGFFGALWEAYDSVLRLIIRPPRARYDLGELGPAAFRFRGARVERVDFELRNARGLKLRCSRWLPRRDRDLDGDAEGGAPAKRGSFVADFFEDNWPLSDSERRRRDAMPTVIYCHGNASCRVEALQALPVCLSLGLSVVALDTAGSGKSEGKFVSLGFFEQSDVAAVDEHLRSACRVDRVALWGRSMGAATCLLYASRLGPETAAVVADSSFMDLRALCRDLARNIAPSVPTNLIDSAVARVASSVDYYAHFHLDDVSPAGAVKTCGAPTLLVHGAKDSFIPPAHAKALFEAFGADDVALVLDEGAHASPRGAKAVEAILQLLTLKVCDGEPSFPLNPTFAGTAPPWSPKWESPKASLAAPPRPNEATPQRDQPSKLMTHLADLYDRLSDLTVPARDAAASDPASPRPPPPAGLIPRSPPVGGSPAKRHRNPEFVPAEPRANAEFAAGMSDDRARAIQDGSAIFGTKK